ncbi:GNAT family N-acetyltransferase [Flagellimonas nanhaiensis]|uniref:GNAT family N-acetyltransferase n=1 Tax=Flagellimonas nanhaiensis TaxID=2292706 RepID=A0A371JRX0_9FLAO|nr:GNAT family N-acetyltransferase [Allomuricauda nanhaiensis]RDY60213.1 GNAT family N-acetyltransferase [Allomuricauda nanhaiensis]
MQTKTRISSTPSELTQIKSWLKKESDETGVGFYGNWNTIQEAWEKKRCFILLHKKSVVGFLVYRTTGPVANIMVFDVKPGLRKEGFGRKLFKGFTEFLKNKGVVVIELFCSPQTSEGFWRKLYFEKLADLYDVKSKRIDMYKIIVPKLAITEKSDSAETIALWDKEQHEVSDCPPKWVWGLRFKKNSRELERPIVHPINYKWLLLWKQGNKVLHSAPIGDFVSATIEYGSFMVITSLPSQ